MKRLFAIVLALAVSASAFADEGMWLLPLLQKLNGKDLRAAGCKLTPEEIYSVNKSSLKDAIVHFGGGCTGEIISREGLLVTNHHCGYSSIQGLSTDEHNYLMDGYWAKTRADEIPVPGLTVTFLVSMADVTGVEEANRDAVVEQAKRDNPGADARIVSFYEGNAQYLIVSRTYSDIRFVGAPPASMGKFGGETDNWMWPRHTCDFSMFRVYAAPDGAPAAYSPDNKPYKPAWSLPISLKGVREGDFAMVLGYPGRTQRYQTAAQLEEMMAVNRMRVEARTIRQDIMWKAMVADPGVRLKYADKYASSANGWKKWQGEELAFANLSIIPRQLQKEAALKSWIEADQARVDAYGDPVSVIAESVREKAPVSHSVTLLLENAYQIELAQFAGAFTGLYGRSLREGVDSLTAFSQAREQVAEAYRDYVEAIDREVAVALLEHYRQVAAKEDYLNIPGQDFAAMDIPAYVDDLFGRSAFVSEEKLRAASLQELLSDPASELSAAVMAVLMPKYMAAYYQSDEAFDQARKHYAAALMEWQKGKAMYPDANSTMRLTYGHVLPYSPKDGVLNRHYTTLKGVMEKENPDDPEFVVPAKVRALYEAGDYGRWADADGTLHTCFLTNNDITGGNSGSPVLDARGNLIGLAFDGNWESMSSDVMFEPELQRCICVDIRYVLWMVEKYGDAGHLIEELKIVKK